MLKLIENNVNTIEVLCRKNFADYFFEFIEKLEKLFNRTIDLVTENNAILSEINRWPKLANQLYLRWL